MRIRSMTMLTKDAGAHEELFDEIARVGREALGELVFELDYLLEHEVLCSSLKRWSSGEDLEEDASKAPVVGSAGRKAQHLVASWEGRHGNARF